MDINTQALEVAIAQQKQGADAAENAELLGTAVVSAVTEELTKRTENPIQTTYTYYNSGANPVVVQQDQNIFSCDKTKKTDDEEEDKPQANSEDDLGSAK